MSERVTTSNNTPEPRFAELRPVFSKVQWRTFFE
jgi:hypothetical protein